MDIVLVPGLWLDGASWDRVTPTLEKAGHRTHPLTLPGMEDRHADRSGVTLADQVAAVVEAIDRADGRVVLVGHSAGCAIAYAALDARPDRVAWAVYIGGFPIPDGQPLVGWLTADGGEDVPMPDWAEIGEEANVADFGEEQLRAFYAAAIPVPAQVVTGRQRLSGDEQRYQVPATAVCPEYTAADLRAWVAAGEEPVRELARIRHVDYVDLPGGHWPQFTQPDKLAGVILDVVAKAAGDR